MSTQPRTALRAYNYSTSGGWVVSSFPEVLKRCWLATPWSRHRVQGSLSGPTVVAILAGVLQLALFCWVGG